MPDEDQKPADQNPEADSASLDAQNSAADNKKTDQKKEPEGHKKILIGKAFVIGGAAVRIDKIPKKAKGGQAIIIHGLNLKIYDGLALFVAGAWYKPINLHLARTDGQAIEFTLPNFNKILSEGSDIWIRVSSSHFPQASGTLNKYIAYTLKDEEEEETAENKAKKEEEKKKAEKEGKAGGKGLGALAEASVANVLGNLAEPFLPAFLKKGNALNDAKSALKSGDKKALKDAVKKSAELKDLDGLKDLLKETKDSESEKLIRESISDLENKALVPEKLDSSEVAKITGRGEEGELDYIDDDSPEVQKAENQENSARLDLHQKQEKNKNFAGQFDSKDTKPEVGRSEFLPENIKQSAELVGEHIDKNPGLIADVKVREKVLSALATGNISTLDNGSLTALNTAIVSSKGASGALLSAFEQVKGSAEQILQVKASGSGTASGTTQRSVEAQVAGTKAGQTKVSGTVTSQTSSETTATVSGSETGGRTKVSAEVQGGARGGEVKAEITGTGAGQTEVSGTISQQAGSEASISASAVPDSGEANVQEKTKSEVNIQGESGLNKQVEAELKEEKSGAVAGAGSQVSKKIDLNAQLSVPVDENLSSDEVGGSKKKPSGQPGKEKGLETEISGEGNKQTVKPIDGSKKPLGQTGNEDAFKQKQGLEEARIQSEASPNVGQKPESEPSKPSLGSPSSKVEGDLPSIVPQKTPVAELSQQKQPLDLPKAERKYPRRPFKDTRSLNDLMGAAIKGKEDLSKHPSAWQAVKRIAEKKLAKPGIGAKSSKALGAGTPLRTQYSSEHDNERIARGDKIGTKPVEDQKHDAIQPGLIKEGVSKPEPFVGEPTQKPVGEESEIPKQEQGESPVSRVASKLASEPGAGEAASQATSKVWWYGFDTAAAVFFSGFDFMIGAIVMDAYWIFGHRKDKKIFPLKTWQKAATIFANIAPLIYIAIILIIILYAGCNFPVGKLPGVGYKASIVGMAGGSEICESFDNITSGLIYGSGETLPPGGVLSTGKWTSQINQAASNDPKIACILRVVVQKESQGTEDIIGCDCAANGHPEKCPAGARSKYYPAYPFNWDQCSYGIGIAQWTIYQRSSSASWNRWQDSSTPSRNLFGDKYYRVEEFLDPQTSLNLTARKFNDSLSRNGNNVSRAFRDYAGSGAPQSWVDERMTLYNMCISNTGGGG